jgi:Ca2+-binding EF-hand superfamily protein
MVFFIEHLSRIGSLQSLDISINRIDFRAALVLEDALEFRRNVHCLNVSHNPLGHLGMRSLLRLLSRSTSGLKRFVWDDCHIGKTTAPSEHYQVFSCASPGGRYILELERPYHRSILRMLYKTCEKHRISPEFAFNDMKSSPSYSHAAKGDCDVWAVPTSGTLTASFSIDKAVEEAFRNIDQWDFAHFVDSYMALACVQPDVSKVVPLLVHWKNVDGQSAEQRAFLSALSSDFMFQYAHIEQMAQNRTILKELIQYLMPSIQGGEDVRFMTMLLTTSLGDYVELIDKQKAFLDLNLNNPNWHYTLDLTQPAHHATAERLLLLDRWETALLRHRKIADTSQHGNCSQIRNELYEHKQIGLSTLQEWNLPERGEFQFDYSSGKRPPSEATPLDDSTFATLLMALQSSESAPHDHIQALQKASHMMYLKSVQMRGLLGIFAEKSARLDLFVVFFLRVVDFYNEKLYRVRFEHQEELEELMSRLGYVTVFPFIQPEQTKFSLDLAVYEQRLAANIILNIGFSENSFNIRDPNVLRQDGTVDPLTSGIPQSWKTFEKMPKGGTISMSYVCSPDDRRYNIRRKFYEMYGHRDGVSETEVMWWAALNQAPEDVLEYVSFLVSKYGSPKDVFAEIDGPRGNGVVTLREFEESYAEMKCHKFKGKDETHRIQSVFRYLDCGGGGEVSQDEWNVLELLWQETKLSITEFVQFCERTFGNDLDETWNFMDADGGGQIDLEEWVTACEKVGFFGPVVPIFGYLDADDEGSISKEEFKQLESFKQVPGNGC